MNVGQAITAALEEQRQRDLDRMYGGRLARLLDQVGFASTSTTAVTAEFIARYPLLERELPRISWRAEDHAP